MNNLDKQYTDLLQDILDNGVTKKDIIYPIYIVGFNTLKYWEKLCLNEYLKLNKLI